jgi:DNA-binding response OmpR family regulator
MKKNVGFAGRTILIVEDEPLIAIEIADRFSNAGARVLTATNLRDGMRLAEHPEVSAAILDFGLHSGDSAAMCRRLRERRVPFVIYSGYPREQIACDDAAFVAKPASTDVLLTTIAGLLPWRPPDPPH